MIVHIDEDMERVARFWYNTSIPPSTARISQSARAAAYTADGPAPITV